MHPWLMGMRDDIVRAKTIDESPASAAGKVWMVIVELGPRHELEEKQSWIERHSPPRPMTPYVQGLLARIRAERGR